MFHIKKKEFVFEDNNYEVRSWLQDDNETYTVKVFLNNEPANGYSYNVSIEDVNDSKRGKFPQALLKDLVDLAENDIKEKKWEKYIENMKDA